MSEHESTPFFFWVSKTKLNFWSILITQNKHPSHNLKFVPRWLIASDYKLGQMYWFVFRTCVRGETLIAYSPFDLRRRATLMQVTRNMIMSWSAETLIETHAAVGKKNKTHRAHKQSPWLHVWQAGYKFNSLFSAPRRQPSMIDRWLETWHVCARASSATIILHVRASVIFCAALMRCSQHV